MKSNRIIIGSEEFEAICHKHIEKTNNWKNKRLYIQGVGYNTKKCKQSLYIDLSTFTVHASTECASQSDSWCDAQTEILLEDQGRIFAFARLLRILCAERKTYTPVAEVMQQALLDTAEVKGYYTEWRNVRIAVNSYGKMANRNRCFMIFCTTTKGSAPRSFVELPDKEYAACVAYYRGDKMMDPYTEAGYYIDCAIKYQHMSTLPSSN